jgi:hypothetical protein
MVGDTIVYYTHSSRIFAILVGCLSLLCGCCTLWFQYHPWYDLWSHACNVLPGYSFQVLGINNSPTGIIQYVQRAYNAQLDKNAEKPRDTRSVLNGGLRTTQEKELLDNSIKDFPKTTNHKAGRWPYQASQFFHKFKGLCSISSYLILS